MDCISDSVNEAVHNILREKHYNGTEVFNKFNESLDNKDEISACAYYILFSLITNKVIEDK